MYEISFRFSRKGSLHLSNIFFSITCIKIEGVTENERMRKEEKIKMMKNWKSY